TGAGAGTGAAVPAREVVLVGGHESRSGAALRGLCREAVTGVGARLYASTRRPAVVVPMTLGRDAGLIEDVARVLRWTGRGREPGELLLAPPLATTGHLVGWIRAAAGRVAVPEPEERAVLVVAPAATAEEDAELFRVARLARQHSGCRRVEVALIGGDPDVAEGVARCRLLGARHVVVVPASFVEPEPSPGAVSAGPLLSPVALEELVRLRVGEAERRWAEHGDDGLAAASTTRHGHEHGHGHGHGHGHHDHSH
ncbi:sirohydrochlorin chelatase, partial [Microtetraspora niveoalba]|uniref:sirohydrochlorin chelatase n=1 Tax=Microtetraspora niveoalba TaxID=46175 RepID=UPI000B07F594